MNKRVWQQLERNSTLDGDGFFVSYNPNTLNTVGCSFMDGDGNGEETALVVPRKGGGKDYLILNGDYRKEYENAIGNIDHCRAIFDANKADHESNWSN